MSSPFITVRGVSKRYAHLLAVDDVTLDVERGEVCAAERDRYSTSFHTSQVLGTRQGYEG